MRVLITGVYITYISVSLQGNANRDRYRMLKDDRVRGHAERSIFSLKDTSERLC